MRRGRCREKSLPTGGQKRVTDKNPAQLRVPGRPVCARCRRPRAVCYCDELAALDTRTRVLVLQHPRERRVAIGTARMAHLALPGSVLRVGVDFAADPVVTAALAGPQPAYVLYPRPGAVAVADLPAGPITLVVLDGTWIQARKLLHRNPALAALPGVALQPRRPSGYRIRRQPAPLCVSTVEALAEILSAIEPDGERFARLLAPFETMVARQERFARETRSARHRRAPRPPRIPALLARLTASFDRLVCVQGEANAWPARHPDRPPPEIVHWLAHRPASGERFEAVVAPREPLGPATPRHIELGEGDLLSGVTVEDWRRSWAAFVRPGDVVVHWGTYYAELAAGDGLLMTGRLDLRAEVSQMLRRRFGTIDACAAALSAAPPAPHGPGRGARRLAALGAVVGALLDAGIGAARKSSTAR
jgi:tRNA-uridine aminocarboxypropyltransferase